jgi:polysaccharide chain length determinant protein (PEP-CTERM system associated)
MGSTSEIRALVFYYLNGLLARRWTILIAAWIVCVIGWFIIAMMPNSYTSTARIYVDTQSLLRPLMKDLAVQPDIERQVDIMRRTLLTRPNLEEIIRRTDLDLTVSTPVELERLVERLSEQIAIKIEGPNLFNIEYSSRSPEQARRVVDTTLQTFVEMNLGDAQQDMEAAQRFIDQQIAEYETKLRNAELRVAEYKRENIGQLTNTERVERTLADAQRELNNLQSTLQSAIWQRDQLQVQLASTPKFTESQRTAVGGGARARISAELEEQRNQLARLLTQYTDRHPDVISQRSLIAQTEERLRSTPGASYTNEETPNPTWEQLNLELQRAEMGISTLETRIAQQQKAIETLTTRITEIPEAQAELVSLTRDYEVLLSQYERLIERRESARMAQRMGAESDNVEFRIIEPPIAPAEPSGPPRVLLMAAVLLLGLGIGGGLAFLRILMTDAFVNPKQLSDAIGLPVIGTLSVARSVLGGPGRVLEATMAACVALFLIGSFAGLTYFYTATTAPPEFRTVVQDMTDAVLQRFGRAI